MLDVHLSGADGHSATILLREDIAELHAEYLQHVCSNKQRDTPLMRSLWIGVAAYSPAAWPHHLELTKPAVLASHETELSGVMACSSFG